MSSLLPKPFKYKDWNIWNRTAIDEMNYNTVGCSDTLNGVCLKNLSLKDCIEESTDGIGYHIEFKNGESICAPLKVDLYPTLNIVYKLVNQEAHPELNDVNITTFLNNNKYNFPPLNSSIIFYYDIIKIKNIESNLYFGINKKDNIIEFTNNEDNAVNLQFIPANTFAPRIVNYEPLKYGDKFNIVIPNTTLILYKNINTDIFEFIESSTINQPFIFELSPINNVGNTNKVLYIDMFTIIYSFRNIVTLNKYDMLEGLYQNIEKLNERDNPNVKNTFMAISQMVGYYCQDDKCVPIKTSNTTNIFIEPEILKEYDTNKNNLIDKNEYENLIKDKDNLSDKIKDRLKYYSNNIYSTESLYNNSTVERSPNCFGACKYWIKNDNSLPEFQEYDFNKQNDEKLKVEIPHKPKIKGNIIIYIIIFIFLFFIIRFFF